MVDKSQIKYISEKPGVYLWKDKNNKVLYVGKAKNLKKRISQYFNNKMQNSFKTSKMFERAFSIETIVTNSEREALIQERKFIDFYRPFYNVLFPNRSTFPYIKVKLTNNDLKIEITNNYKKENNATYFGPLPNNKNFKPLLKYLSHLFLANKGEFIKEKDFSFWKEQYEKVRNTIKHPSAFLLDLSNKLEEAKENLDFELAKLYSDVLDTFTYNQDKQYINIVNKNDIDVVGIVNYKDVIFFSLLSYRDGFLLSTYSYAFEILNSETTLINEFLNRYYEKNDLPAKVVLDKKYKNSDFDLINYISFENTNEELNLISIANDNALNNIEVKYDEFIKTNNILTVQEKLGTLLNLSLNNIVILDNSFFINTNNVVGGVCVFQNGEENRKLFRHFNLNLNYSRNADVEYMFQSALKYFKLFPDFADAIFVDGAIAQINEVKKALDLLGLNIKIFGLVKDDKHETRMLIDENNNEIKINDKSIFNFLSRMQTIVDRYVKNVYQKKELEYILDNELLNIKGIGKKTIMKLLSTFNTYQNILNASYEDLEKASSNKIAKLIKGY